MKIRSTLTSAEFDKRKVSAILHTGQSPMIRERLDIVCADGAVRCGVCEKINLFWALNSNNWFYARKNCTASRRKEITRKLGYDDEASVYMENEIARQECALIEW